MTMRENVNNIFFTAIIGLIRAAYKEWPEDCPERREFLSGGGANGGRVCQLLMLATPEVRMSEDAYNRTSQTNFLIENILLAKNKSKEKAFITATNSVKSLVDRRAAGQEITRDHNSPNKAIINKLFNLVVGGAEDEELMDVLRNERYLDIITIEENDKLDKEGYRSTGSVEQRDAFCSPKKTIIEFYPDLDKSVVEKFAVKY